MGRARGRRRHQPGGILSLILLIEEHRAAIRYDWRTRFGKSLDAIPGEFSWSEAIDLARILRSDPSSQLAASVEGWDYPFAHSDWMLADLIDIQGGKAAGKKWKNYPRPSDPKLSSHRHGNASGRTPEEVKELLRTAFGQRANTA